MRRFLLILAVSILLLNGVRAQVPASATSERYVPPEKIEGDGLDEWIKKLSHPDPATRIKAIQTLPMFGPPAAKAVPQLVKLLDDRDISVRLAAMYVISNNPIKDPVDIENILRSLYEQLVHGQTAIRIQAAIVIGKMGPAAYKAIPRLISDYQIRYPSSYEVREAAAFALGRVAFDYVHGPNTDAILALIRAMSDECLKVRVAAVDSLIILGRPFNAADEAAELKILQTRLGAETNKVLSLWVRVALIRLETPQNGDKLIKPIADALRSDDVNVRNAATDCVAILGSAASSIAGHLRVGLQLVSDKPEDLEFRARCLYAAGKIGGDAKFLGEDITPSLTHKDARIRGYAKEAMDSITGQKPPQVAPR